MAAVIQRLSRQALVTFMTTETPAFSSNFERLKAMVSHMLTVLNCQIRFLDGLRFSKSGTCLNARTRDCMCLAGKT